jgi:hypothetical protein
MDRPALDVRAMAWRGPMARRYRLVLRWSSEGKAAVT